MIGRALDSNNDLIVEGGRLKIVKDGEEVVQHVRTRLLFYFNEWFLDRLTGVPYFEEIFTKPVNLSNIESVLKARILSTPEFKTLTEFTMEYTGADSRELLVSCSGTTVYGVIDNLKVTVNV